MHDLAFEQVRQCRQPDMRMRTHIDAARNAGVEVQRTEVIEEDERTHHPPLGKGKHAADDESAEVAASLFDDEIGHVVLLMACREV